MGRDGGGEARERGGVVNVVEVGLGGGRRGLGGEAVAEVGEAEEI
jgi:hypothetical protein